MGWGEILLLAVGGYVAYTYFFGSTAAATTTSTGTTPTPTPTPTHDAHAYAGSGRGGHASANSAGLASGFLGRYHLRRRHSDGRQ